MFNMVDRRKTLHRRACELAARHPELFLSTEIPYASVVEQMTVRRMPIAVNAAHTHAARAFAGVWDELQARLHRTKRAPEHERWAPVLHAIESSIARLESTEPSVTVPVPVLAAPDATDLDVVHRFDTETGDLERHGHRIELRERGGVEFLVVARSDES